MAIVNDDAPNGKPGGDANRKSQAADTDWRQISTTDLPIDIVLGRLQRVTRRSKTQYSARCPAHVDTQPSLSVSETDDGTVLLHCHAGCKIDQILKAVGLA